MQEIFKAIKSIEQEHSCKIIYACESGSRAWGFSSSDSDFDVRFIYLQPKEKYLSINSEKDTIEAMLPGDLDLVGWDFKKILQHIYKSNASMLEWFDSPIVYYKDESLFSILYNVINEYFNPKQAMFHYWNLASGFEKEHLQSKEVNIKKLFYILRAVFASKWIEINCTMPPTLFIKMLNDTLVDEVTLAEISNLIEVKKNKKEKDKVVISENLFAWIKNSIRESHEIAEKMLPIKNSDYEPLNRIFRGIILV